MKKFAQTLILLIAAVTIFLTGGGVTIVNYCCTSCSGQTLFMTEQHVCCGQEQEESVSCCSTQELSRNGCQSDAYTKDTHCTASRLSVDIAAFSFRPHVAAPFVWISDASLALYATILPEKVEYDNDCTLFESPPNIPPREYLSLIRVLII